MKRQCYNPYLPSWEYIPDAEPKVFGQRLYIYGSHDLFGAKEYCEGDYVCWSTPVDDLSDWRYEGVIFKKQDTPWNKKNLSYYAPDVVRGTDGRYYLYYSVAVGRFVRQTCGKIPILGRCSLPGRASLRLKAGRLVYV